MLDLVIRNALVVDGSGRPGRPGDLGVQDGRIVAMGAPGEVDDSAATTVDATDLVVCPGFVDVHTHFDAQAFWDPTLSPSPLHGVTTVVGGNCGFTIAPLVGTDADHDYLMRMLARVEGMPLESLQLGVPWDWRTTGEYLDRLDHTLMPNAGFLVGHSALRRGVMHDEAGGAASPEQIAAMQALLADGLRAGALGFSSSWSQSHNDHEGHPVPSRAASLDELLALCSVVGEHEGTTLEFIPGLGSFPDELFGVMAAMSNAANRPLNWNVLQVAGTNRDLVQHQLAGGEIAAAQGGRVVALTVPDTLRFWLNFRSGFILDILPGWAPLMGLAPSEKLAMLADPSGRAEMDRRAQTIDRVNRSIAHWASYTIVESATPEYQPYVGRPVSELAAARGVSAWDALADLVVADELRTVIATADRGQDDASWAHRVEVWRDPRALIGASDAGAHLDMIDSFSFATTVLGRAVRERGLLPLEEAISYLTDSPARLYGLKDRGRLALGAWADLVVLDPTTIGPGPLHTRYDLPGGAGRLYGRGEGIERVFVAGTEVVRGGETTEARPGRVLRSGRDTETVTAHGR